MSTSSTTSRQHRSLGGQWVACTATVRPCPRTEHRDDPQSAERRAFIEDIKAQIMAREADDLPVDVHAEIASEAVSLLGEYAEMEFANHADVKYGEWITLEEMEDGDKARNNCAIVTAELLERITEDQFGGVAVGEITLYAGSGSGQHVAIVTYVNDEWYVVDYTIRQYDQSLPFPYVAPQNEWKATVERVTDLDWYFDGDLDEDEEDEE